MAWLSVNEKGIEYMNNILPTRCPMWGDWDATMEVGDEYIQLQIELPDGTIKKLLGYELTWSDEPVMFGV